MKCDFCGALLEDNAKFCSVCGKELQAQEVKNGEPIAAEPQIFINPVAERLLTAFKSKLYLAVCVLLTVSVAIGVTTGSFDIIGILLAIFFWIIYSKAQKNTVNARNIKWVSNTVFALKIIYFVLIGLMGLLVILIGFVAATMGSVNLGEILASAGPELTTNIPYDILSVLTELSASFIFGIVAAVLLFVLGLMIVIVIFAIGSFRKFAESVYKSFLECQFDFHKASATKVWLIVMGVMTGLSALGSIDDFMLFLTNGTSAAAMVTASVLIDKYFEEQ